MKTRILLLLVFVVLIINSISCAHWIRLEVNSAYPTSYAVIEHPGDSNWKCDYLSVCAHGITECRDQVNGRNRYFLQLEIEYSTEGTVLFPVYNGTGELKFYTELIDLQDQGFLRTIYRDVQ